MKKFMKFIGVIATVGILFSSGYLLGTAQSTKAMDQQRVLENNTYSEKRIMSGKYYDYMVIETEDGNEWLLDDSEDNPYIENDHVIFEAGESVQVVFDTMGTDIIEDDVIVDIVRTR